MHMTPGIGQPLCPKRFNIAGRPSGVSRTSTEDVAAKLREHASNHTTVLTLKRDLPELPTGGPVDQGLYMDLQEVPGMVVNGELRVSVARLVSVGHDGTHKMVGQIQATRVLDHPLETWSMRFYVHVHRFFATHEVDHQEQWFVRVLEQHYRNGGDQVALEPAVEA